MPLIGCQETEFRKPTEEKLTQFVHATREDKIGLSFSKLITGEDNSSLSRAEGLDQGAIDSPDSKFDGDMARGGIRDGVGKEHRI
jgi:hypothetical protein